MIRIQTKRIHSHDLFGALCAVNPNSVSQTLVRLRFLAECDAKPIASGLTCVFLTGAAFVVFTFQMYKNYHSSKEVVEVIVCGWRACSVDVVRWFLINRRLQEFEKST